MPKISEISKKDIYIRLEEPKKYCCKSCLYFEYGECHRYPPMIYRGSTRKASHPRPESSNVWCGEYKKKDKKK